MDQTSLYREVENFSAYFRRSPDIAIGKETLRSMFHWSERQIEEAKKGFIFIGCNTIVAEFSFGFILY